MQSITIEVKPFLKGGHILVTKLNGRKEKTEARFLPRFEYEYLKEDLDKLTQIHL